MLVWHSYFDDRHVAGKKYDKSEVAILILDRIKNGRWSHFVINLYHNNNKSHYNNTTYFILLETTGDCYKINILDTCILDSNILDTGEILKIYWSMIKQILILILSILLVAHANRLIGKLFEAITSNILYFRTFVAAVMDFF